MENWRENFSVIARLKVPGKPADSLAQRLFFERLFGGANFHPPGISPRAVVCIRKVKAPPFENRREPFGAPPLDWESGIRGTIENLTRRAFRPVRQIVPAEAESVFFEDAAEMLACLARDWLGGDLSGCWWWRALFPKLFYRETIVNIWLERAEFAPAALELLSKSGEALSFVKKLEPAEAAAVLHEITLIFGLAKLSAALVAPPGQKARAEVSEPVIGKPLKTHPPEMEIPAAFAKSNDIFARLIPESISPDLSFERRVLLETAFLLARSPRLARSPEFAERVVLLRAKNELEKTVTVKTSVAVVSKKIEPRAADEQAREQTKAPPRRGKSEARKKHPPGEKDEPQFSAPPETEKSEKTAQKAPLILSKMPESTVEASSEIEKKQGAPAIATIEFETFQSETVEKKPTAQKTKTRERSSISPPARERIFENVFEQVESEIERRFQTRFGGIFYLLNLGLFLGLYRDFTEPPTDEIDLNIWDFVALVGLEFLGDEIKADAVWEFLMRAASRENDRDFGREFDQSRDWRVPPVWLATFSADQTWFWAQRGKRLVVRHPDGFNVIDVRRRRGQRAEAQLKGELEIYRQNFARTVKANGKNEPLPESRSWLKNLAEYLQKRLFRALDRQTPEAMNAILFGQRASVTVSATHLEITFALADLPIEVRLAGLDRDPAWIPAAGKFVYFHFV